MKLLQEYTFDYIRRNKRSSAGLMVAVLTVTIMLSALCSYMFNSIMTNIQYYIKDAGNWHSELFDVTYGSDLAVVESFESVEAVMVKGEWQIAAIDDPRRKYLFFRNANEAYWDSMPESGAILEGRVPQAEGEIAVSKQYFEYHPQLKVGDSITLPIGKRITSRGEEMEIINPWAEGEQFFGEGQVTLKVVGKLDVATNSQVPAYTALGYLEDSEIGPEEEITVYLRFKNVRDTYKETPLIAEAMGYELDEFGKYAVKYNEGYLGKLFVFSPERLSNMNLFDIGAEPLAILVGGLFVMAVFVMIIHNAFMLSANARLTQLGILASIGATPRQIKHSVVFEGLVLTLPVLPLGILLGNLAVVGIIDFANKNISRNLSDEMVFQISWLSVLVSIVMTLITVWWSALIPAGKIAKMSPIDAIRQGGAGKLKRPGKQNVGKLFGIEGLLAGNAVWARRSSYRTAVIAIGLSFFSLVCMVLITSVTDTRKAIYQPDARRLEEADIFVSLYGIMSSEDMKTTEKIGELEGIASHIWYKEENMAVWLDKNSLSEEFNCSGGFEEASKIKGRDVVFQRDGKYRVVSCIVGLDDNSFREYCSMLGIDWEPFYEEDIFRSVIYNKLEDITVSTLRNPVFIPFLNVKPSDQLEFTEKIMDNHKGEYSARIEAGAVTQMQPPLAFNLAEGYNLLQIMPIGRLKSLAESFVYGSTKKVTGILKTKSGELIKPLHAEIEKICESSYGSGDYRINDEIEYLEGKWASSQMMKLVTGFISGMFAVIGLSNAWATIRGSLGARRKEFAMLRSVGLSPKGMRRMMTMEALLLGGAPLLGGLPAAAGLLWIFLNINEVTLAQWVPFVPWWILVLYAGGMQGAMGAAYYTGARKLRKENIVEAVKMEAV